jgi:hypothetical protein
MFRYEDKTQQEQKMLAALEAGKAPSEWSQQQNAERPWAADLPLGDVSIAEVRASAAASVAARAAAAPSVAARIAAAAKATPARRRTRGF